MKIDTDDWLTLSDACVEAKMPQVTGYRIAKRLGIVEVIFGTRVVRKKDGQKMIADRKRVGNPVWIESHEEAAASALRAVESRKKRIAADGLTDAEKQRSCTQSRVGVGEAARRAGRAAINARRA